MDCVEEWNHFLHDGIRGQTPVWVKKTKHLPPKPIMIIIDYEGTFELSSKKYKYTKLFSGNRKERKIIPNGFISC